MTDEVAGLAPVIVNAMTVDVEDYFHASAFDAAVDRGQWDGLESRIVANTERVLGIFDEAGVHATFFVLGWVAERHPDLVRRIDGCGHEIASHSYAHRLVYRMSREEFREDLRRARGVLEEATGKPVLGFRAPSYSITSRSLWALDVLAEEGFLYDASIFPIHHDRYGIPRSPRHAFVVRRGGRALFEIPASTVRWVSLNLPVAGGAYFRFLPFAVTRTAIARLHRLEQRPAIFYVHPWELDPGQPRIRIGWAGALRHYHNLARTEGRLRRLIRHFRFDSIAGALLAAPVLAALPPVGLQPGTRPVDGDAAPAYGTP